MEIEIVSEKRNNLIGRNELKLFIRSEITPRREELKKQIAELKKVNENVVVVKNIYGQYGTHEYKSIIYIYDSEEILKNFEPKKKEKKVQQKGV